MASPEAPLSATSQASGADSGKAGGLWLELFAAFAAAFLLFAVQPLVAKRILPWFGGTPEVWMVCLAFYQLALFVGYAYAHGLIRFVPPRSQVLVHAALLGLAVLVLPVLPEESWRSITPDSPRLQILAMLTVFVGIPFCALASTGPLIQTWFAQRHANSSPYRLYAVSNLGSFAALLAYPLWVEPRFSISATGEAWSLAFAVTAVAILTVGWLARGASLLEPKPAAARSPRPGLRDCARWAGLAGVAVALLMGVSNKLTLDVAAVPFLWILPLATYLLTFVLAFASERFIPRRLFAGGAASSALLIAFGTKLFPGIEAQIALYCSLLFFGAACLHGELARGRPAPEWLTTFYLTIAGGGALGGLLTGIAAPALLNDYYELPLSLGLAWGILLLVWRRDPKSLLGPASKRRTLATGAALLALPLATGILAPRPHPDTIHHERTFFGVVTVRETEKPGGRERQLWHGTTEHGMQLLEAASRRTPTTYYGVRTPIGLLMQGREPGDDTRVGVVGMGIGSLAGYGREGDVFRFYEIDPAIVRIARDPALFDMLTGGDAKIEVVEGDGRISLEAENREQSREPFDILVLDAFSSDAVPVHLLTREALSIYRAALKPDGVLAVHISNRYLNLAPVVARAGSSVDMRNLVAFNPTLPGDHSDFSRWIFLSSARMRMRQLHQTLAKAVQPAQEGRRSPMTLHFVPQNRLLKVPLWTDDWSDLWSTLARRSGTQAAPAAPRIAP